MPRYYFNLDDTNNVLDPDGTVLADNATAISHGVQVMHELMFKRPGMLGQAWSAWTMRVSDRDGKTVQLIPFADVHERPRD